MGRQAHCPLSDGRPSPAPSGWVWYRFMLALPGGAPLVAGGIANERLSSETPSGQHSPAFSFGMTPYFLLS